MSLRGWAVALVVAGLLLQARPASACSCDPYGPEDLARAGAAFVGETVSRRVVNPDAFADDGAVWTFRVEAVVKGDLPAVVEAASPVDGAACGLELRPGERTGLLLFGKSGEWRSNLCAQVPPEVLAAGGPGRPPGRPPSSGREPASPGGGAGLPTAALAAGAAGAGTAMGWWLARSRRP